MKYVVFSCETADPEQEIGCTYGIYAENLRISNITSIREEAEELAALLNRMEVSPIHFRDVVEDFVEEKSSL